MATSKVWRILLSLMVSVLVLSSFAGIVTAATEDAPVAQELRAQEVKGTIAGGQSAEIWLGLETVTPNEKITLISAWDRLDPRGNGLGFYVLTDQNRSEVLSGTDPRLANLATGSKVAPESPDNEVGAEFLATSDFFTLIVYNDSNDDANFTISAKNAFITDGSGQVEDAAAASEDEMEMADEAAGEEAAGEEAAADEAGVAADEEAAAAETATPAEEEAPATDEADAAAAAEEPEVVEPEAADEAKAQEDAATVVETTPGVVEAQELEGELPEKDDQHFLGLAPSVKDGRMDLVMAYHPADSSDLASRIGFWVLDQDAFNRYLNPDENVVLSQVAIAAGSGDQPELESNERSASFTASGMGPYTVITYNNSNVPATYSLRVDGGVLTDDSGQTTTAMKSMEASEAMTDTVGADEATAGEEADVAGTAIELDEEAGAGPTRTAEPGETYTVQPGDTLSLIAADIYGDIGAWEDICSFNNIADCNVMEVGDELQLPTTDQLGAGATAPTATTTPAAEEETAAADTATAPAADEVEADATEAVTTTREVTTGTEVTGTEEVTGTSDSADAGDTAESDETALADLLTTLEAQGGMTILVDALKAASLDDTLMKDPGPFTIFAPTDAAFENTLPNYQELFDNPAGMLTELLLYHIVSDSEIASEDIADGMEAATAHQALPVKFEITGDSIKVQDSVLTLPDLKASNGVAHIIDKVMIPSDISQ